MVHLKQQVGKPAGAQQVSDKPKRTCSSWSTSPEKSDPEPGGLRTCMRIGRRVRQRDNQRVSMRTELEVLNPVDHIMTTSTWDIQCQCE